MSSICRDFEELCQAALDRREADGLGPALAEHANSCPACFSIFSRYLHLRQAIGVLPTPVPAEDFADRALRAFADHRPATIPYRRFARLAAGLAAAILIAGIAAYRDRPRPGPAERPIASGRTPRALGLALSDATHETLGLAREASAPAARVGRQVIESASMPSLTFGLAVSDDPASDVLQSVGDGVEAGVRPLSGSARSAFGFLIPGGSRFRGRSEPSKAPKGT